MEEATAAEQLSQFLDEHLDETFLLIDRNETLDTWLVQPNLRITDKVRLLEQSDRGQLCLGNIEIPIIWYEHYPKQIIDYVIVPHSTYIVQDENCNKVNEACSSLYDVYYIKDSMKPITIFELYLEENEKIQFSNTDWNASEYVAAGIARNENDFTWSNASSITFKRIKLGKLSSKTQYMMNIDLYGIFGNQQNIQVICNDEIIYDEHVYSGGNIILPINTDENGYLDLRIDLPTAISPYSNTDSVDNEVFALQLKSISFSKTR